MNSIAEPIDIPDQAAVARLLAPLSADAPCGPPARYDPVFTEIRLLREEDDPQLPMGQWERPLKRADWPAIEAKCIDMLSSRSKDLQIAVWLVEAWLRQHGFAGLRQGLQVLGSLLRAYWDDLHPQIESDAGGAGDAEPDLDARLAPLEWLNESLSASLRVHTVLVSVSVEAGKPAPVTLAEWERMTMREMAPQPSAGMTRADVVDGVLEMGAELLWMHTAIEACQDALAAVADLLRSRLAALAPNLGKLAATLESARRVLAQLHESAGQAQAGDALVHDDAAIMNGDAEAPANMPEPDRHAVGERDAKDGPPWRNRAEAYAALAMLGEYLADVEPHSPTPFLIRRAVNWGRMSLPEVVAEIIREEGDIHRLLNVLAVRP